MPYHDALDDALQFEVWVARAAKRGQLVLSDLVESYGELAQSLQLDTAAPKALGAISLIESLRRLPKGFEKATTLMAVASLSALGQTPIDNQTGFAAAWLDQQTLLVACPQGLVTLQALAMTLCALMHESAKYRRLCADAQTAMAFSDHTQADVFFALVAGISLDDWHKADAAAGGNLDAYLSQLHIPDLRVHPSLHPNQQQRLAHATGQRILATLAESGLGDRPVHLWLGPPQLTDILSPYARDLGPQLMRWAEQNSAVHPASDIYTAMDAFIASDPRLAAERRAVDLRCGIWRSHIEDTPYDIIDLRRLDVAFCDATLTQLQACQQQGPLCPIVLRLDLSHGSASAALVAHLARVLGTQLASITLIGEGSWPTTQTQPVALVRTHLPMHAGAPCRPYGSFPDAPLSFSLAPTDTFVDVPMPARHCPQSVIESLTHEAHGVSFGLMPLVYTLMRLGLGPSEAPTRTQLQCLLVETKTNVADTQAQLACARLDALLAPPKAQGSRPHAQPGPQARGGIRLRV